MERIQLAKHRFLLVDLKEEVYLEVICSPRKSIPYVKERTLEQVRDIISISL